MRWGATLAWLALAALCSTSCGAQQKRRPNFVVVVVDTLRADRLDPALRAEPLAQPRPSPHFDALRRSSVSFLRAYANAPWTLPSLASLFTSQIASRHQVVLWGTQLSGHHVTLSEVLQSAGYRTAAWTSNVLFNRESGFQQGFDAYEVVFAPGALQAPPGALFPNASAPLVSQRALHWLLGLRDREPVKPFFLYLHYMEPHTPYRCRRGAPPACTVRATDLNERLHAEQWNFDARERLAIEALYDGEVLAMDRGLGQLLRALEKHGLRDDTWLIVTADHGEQLGEEGVYLHGRSLDRQEIHIPLLFDGPGVSSAIVDAPVSLIDVAPTVLDLAGIEAPVSFEGRSLRPALEGRHLASTPVISEIFQTSHAPPRHRLAVLSSHEKLVLTPGGEVWRFDLERDPTEQEPQPASRDELNRALGPLEDVIDWRGAREAPELDAETRSRLRALGYGWQ